MIGSLILVALAGVAFALLGLSYKVAEATQCRPTAFTTVFLLVAALSTGARAVVEVTAWADPRLWWLGLFMGLCAVTSVSLVVRANQLGPASVVWTILNLSLLVPIVLASVLLGESLLLTDGLSLVVFFLMLLALSRGVGEVSEASSGGSHRFWLYVAGMFLLNGGFLFGFKLKDSIFPADSGAGLASIYFGFGAILAFAAHRLPRQNWRFARSEWQAGLLAGASSGLGNLFMLGGASLPATIIYPASQGISLLGGVLLTALFYRERLNVAKWTGVVLGLAVLVLAAWREALWRFVSGS